MRARSGTEHAKIAICALLILPATQACNSGNSAPKDAGSATDGAIVINARDSGASPDGGTARPDSGTAPADSGTAPADSGTLAPGDAGSSPADAGMSVDLQGTWNDNGRTITIAQSGRHVTATYQDDYLCDLDLGPVPPGESAPSAANVESTRQDFTATLDTTPTVHTGDTMTGTTTTCRHGYAADAGLPNGLVDADLVLTVTDANTLTGEWSQDTDGDGIADERGSVSITRVQ